MQESTVSRGTMDHPLSHIIVSYFSHPGQDSETRRKTVIFASCLLVLTPSIYLFACVNLWTGHWQDNWPPLILATCMLFLLATMRLQPTITIPFRVIALLALVTLGYELQIGGGDGYAFVWFYCFPMVVFYVAGLREGLFWVAASMLLVAAILLFSSAREIYGTTASFRFLLTYGIVAVISRGLESSRAHYYRELLAEKNSLEQAVQQIKTLRGMLPICSSCKSIRDDQGYWSQIETYLNDHSEAKLSHGICPACLELLYPTEYAEMSRTGRLRKLFPPEKK